MQIYKAEQTLGGEGIVVRREVANRIKEAHLHEFIEIIFIRSGEGVESVGGVDYSVRRGDMIFVNFGKEHGFFESRVITDFGGCDRVVYLSRHTH